MTRRHFQLIADVLREAKCLSPAARGVLARDFARALCGENSRFDSERFIAACIPEEEKKSA